MLTKDNTWVARNSLEAIHRLSSDYSKPEYLVYFLFLVCHPLRRHLSLNSINISPQHVYDTWYIRIEFREKFKPDTEEWTIHISESSSKTRHTLHSNIKVPKILIPMFQLLAFLLSRIYKSTGIYIKKHTQRTLTIFLSHLNSSSIFSLQGNL